ncbi:cytoplasmic protein [Cytidiella melzeri]|nr:cytoplasmic protein [Cytidiella melzeri]
MVATGGQRRGVWEPLPQFIYGYAVHSLSPSRRDTRMSHRSTRPPSVFTDASGEEHLVHRDVVSLEVGDEVYAFERYTPKDKEVEGVWYRGYVVCTSRRPPVTWNTSSDPSTSTAKAPTKVVETQQVFIGIFPASHIFIRDELSDAEGLLAEMANLFSSTNNGSVADVYAQWNRDRPQTEISREEDRDDRTDAQSIAPRKSTFKITPAPDQANSTRARLPVYPASIRSVSPTPTESQANKPLPPRPSLRSADDTVSGIEQPIIDEIASALREWHMLMFQYLARRDYKLFELIREHIEALHLGRRQLLAQTLSADETVNLRRQCVARLVRGNLVQGLDIIVRHPTWGSLVTVDVEGEIDPQNWISAVRMYAMQVSLAYMDISAAITADTPRLGASLDYVPNPQPQPTSPISPLTEFGRSRTMSKSLGSLARTVTTQPTRPKFYHIFLDLRAFVASPCAPGETAELIFSLLNKNEGRFVSEEFCVVLNHNGVLARDPTARIRTLFTDLTAADAQEPLYLVCYIVRNGAMKMGSSMGSILESNKRNSESFSTHWSEANDVHGRAPSDLPPQFRRPFGCAVLELAQLRRMAIEGLEISPTREHTMPIFVPVNEATFSMLHTDILYGHHKEYEKSPRAEMLAVSVKVFYGDTDTIVRENTSLLQDTPLTLRLGFPDVVFPGDVRNELYIKLWSGDFTSSQTGNARRSVASFARGQVGTISGNVQVSIEVRDSSGRVIERVITRCSGEPPMSEYNSLVFQRTSQPSFNELVKVKLPAQGAQQWHLFFTFRQRNIRERSNRNGTDIPERPFAFGFLPLFPDGRAFLEDGAHTLALYKADRLSQLTPESYLSATPLIVQNQQVQMPVEMQKITPLSRDTLLIRSSLCSTKFTQNSVLLSLLNWHTSHDKELISAVLTKFTFVSELEIVKFLRDIFDSLFGILVSQHNQNGEMDHLIFNALVTVLGLVQDRRFSNFQPVLDVYIEQHFTCAAASSHMIHSMNRLLLDPTNPETASALRSALKVWHYVFKFITRSRELQKAKELGMGGGATASHLESNFKKELLAHLSQVNRLMSTTSPASIIGTQTIALRHFTSILPELFKVFSVEELVQITTTFANAVIAAKGQMVIWKLIMYLQVVRGFLFDIPQARSLLVEAVVIWIKPHFGRFDEFSLPGDTPGARDSARVSWLESNRLSVTVLAVMLDKLQQNLVNPDIANDKNLSRQEQYNVECLLSLMPKLLDAYMEFQSPASRRAMEQMKSPSALMSNVPVTFPESYPFALLSQLPKAAPTAQSSNDNKTVYNSGLGETAIVILVLILSSQRKHLMGFFESIFEIEGRDNLASLLVRAFKVASSILSGEAFPSNWLNVNILAHKVLIKMFDPVGALMEREFIPSEASTFTFDANLWKDGLSVLLRLLSSEHLAIEEASHQKRRAVWRLVGDIRGEGAAILLRIWNALGWQVDLPSEGRLSAPIPNYQITLSSIVGHVVNLCLSHHDQLQSNAVYILYCMIVSQFHDSGHFDDIENELVSKLDTLFMSDSKGDDVSRTFFVGHLRHLFESSEVDSELRQRVLNFLDSVDIFLALLLSVRALPEGEEFADDRVIATLRLMNYIRRIGRDEMYIKYVHQLANMHLQAQNYVEAALTLKLHADLHQWDLNSFAPSMPELGLPQQSEFHRKETLCLLILDYLGQGKAWESALEICKELTFQHAEVTFNYSRLAEILRLQAALLEHIVTDQRYYSDYFRVAFYGNFPVGIRHKQFVYRGYEWEKFGAFCERMLNKHPGAQLLKTFGDPPVDIRFGTDQFIQCTAVVPEPNRDLPIFTNPDVPAQIRTYYEHSAINVFSYSRPVIKVGPDNVEETWVEKTYLTTEEAFPTVLRRSEVVDVAAVEISPIETALQEVQQRTRELEGLNTRYAALAKTTQSVSTTLLAMSLNAAVDAPITGGIASFRQSFLAEDYLARYPDRAEKVEKLRLAIDDQVRVIDSCLKLHGQLCPSEMLAFHTTLEGFFKKNFHEEIQRLAMDSPSRDAFVSARVHHALDTTAQFQVQPEQHSVDYSVQESSSLRRPPPLDLRRTISNGASTVAPTIPRENGRASMEGIPPPKQTPLQKSLAHLARHGVHGVASSPRDTMGSDFEDAPHEYLANGSGGPITNIVGSAASTVGSMGSLKGRFSRLGSLNFGRRDG